ncbi:hypothetical protein HK104_005065, partial [Borealophlyctis nickersoniae]
MYETLLREPNKALQVLQLNQKQYVEAAEALQKTLGNVEEGTKQKQFLKMATAQLQRASGGYMPDISDVTVTSWEVDIGDPIASGAFGEVCIGTWLGHTKVAVKRLLTSCETEKVRQSFMKEVEVWRKLRHDYILPLFGACVSAQRPFMVCPYMPNGTLISYVERFPTEGTRLLYESSQGMNYLHTHGVIHGDFKGVNVLINEAGHAQICDFGFASVKAYVTQRSSDKNNDNSTGTLRWMAPELLDGAPPSTASDVYAFSITWWEVVTQGTVPYPDVTSNMVLMDKIKKGKRPNRPTPPDHTPVPDDVWAFVERCWAQDAAHRPNFAVIAEFLKKDLEKAEFGRGVSGGGGGPADVYISYCWANSAKAIGEAVGGCDPRNVNDALRRRGFSTWLDVERLRSGSTFEDSAAGILEAKLFVACISNDYAASAHCVQEFMYAAQQGIPIFPVIVSPGTEWIDTEIGAALGGSQCLQASDGSDEALQHVAEEISAFLAGDGAPLERKPSRRVLSESVLQSPMPLESPHEELFRRLTLSEGAKGAQEPIVVTGEQAPTRYDSAVSMPAGSRVNGGGAAPPRSTSAPETGVKVPESQDPARMSVRYTRARGPAAAPAPAAQPPKKSLFKPKPAPTIIEQPEPQSAPATVGPSGSFTPPVGNGAAYLSDPERFPFPSQSPSSPPMGFQSQSQSLPPSASTYLSQRLAAPSQSSQRASRSSTTGITINFSDRTLTSLDVTSLTSRLRTDRSISALYLPRCNLNQLILSEIFGAMDANPVVRELNLSGNPLALQTPQIAASFKRMLGTNPTLRELDLSHCKLNPELWLALGAAVATNMSLTRLCLAYNAPVDEGSTGALATGLERNESIEDLDLRGCGIGLAGAVRIVDVLTTNESLMRVDLRENLLGAQDVSVVEGMVSQSGIVCRVEMDGGSVAPLPTRRPASQQLPPPPQHPTVFPNHTVYGHQQQGYAPQTPYPPQPYSAYYSQGSTPSSAAYASNTPPQPQNRNGSGDR